MKDDISMNVRHSRSSVLAELECSVAVDFLHDGHLHAACGPRIVLPGNSCALNGEK